MFRFCFFILILIDFSFYQMLIKLYFIDIIVFWVVTFLSELYKRLMQIFLIVEVNLNYYQELYRAALKGNWKEAKSFLDRDPDAVKARISNLKMTALHVAACEGHSEFVENIVALMPAAELAQLDDLGYTALHYAAIGGSLRSAKALLAANSNLTQVVDSEGRTPLLLAASLGSESKEVVWYLLLVTTDEKPGQPFTGPRAAYLVNVLIASGLHGKGLSCAHNVDHIGLFSLTPLLFH